MWKTRYALLMVTLMSPSPHATLGDNTFLELSKVGHRDRALQDLHTDAKGKRWFARFTCLDGTNTPPLTPRTVQSRQRTCYRRKADVETTRGRGEKRWLTQFLHLLLQSTKDAYSRCDGIHSTVPLHGPSAAGAPPTGHDTAPSQASGGEGGGVLQRGRLEHTLEETKTYNLLDTSESD